MQTIALVHYFNHKNVLAMHQIDTFLHDDNLTGVMQITLQGASFIATRESDMIIVRNSDNVIVYSNHDSGKNTYHLRTANLHEQSIIDTFHNYYGES